MFRKLRFVGIGFLVLLCVGCSSTKTVITDDSNQPQAQPVDKLAAAKINVRLGFYYLQQGETVRAKQKLMSALQEAPKYPLAYSAMGYYLEKTGEPVQAEQYYLQSLKFREDLGAMRNNYGTFLCRQKRYREAIQQFEWAVQDKSYLNTAEAYENAGLCSRKIPDILLATQYLNKALKNNPNLPNSLFEMGVLSYEQGKYEAANQYLQQYLQIATPTRESATLGIKINQKLGNKKMVAFYKDQLR
jgi:type IV pilus assembly protein PilF